MLCTAIEKVSIVDLIHTNVNQEAVYTCSYYVIAEVNPSIIFILLPDVLYAHIYKIVLYLLGMIAVNISALLNYCSTLNALIVNLIPSMQHKVPFQLFGTWSNDLYPLYPHALQTLPNNYYPAFAHAQQGVKQSVCLSSVAVSIKIGKSQHLSKCRVNKWDKMV